MTFATSSASESPSYQQHSTSRNVAAEPAAVMALIMAICSFIVPLLPAILALFLAAGAKRNIRASEEQRGGQRIATAAQIVSAVSLVLALVVLVSVYAFTVS